MSQQARPILVLPFKATTTIFYGRAVKPAAVSIPTALGIAIASVSGERVIGIANRDANVGDFVDVTSIGTAAVYAGAPIAVGDRVQADAAGRGITLAGGTAFGTALQAATAAGQYIEVLLG